MITKKALLALLTALFIGGCSTPTPTTVATPLPAQAISVSGQRLMIRLDGINKILAKSLPIKRSGSFGKIKILNVLVSEASEPKHIVIGVRFNLIKFEIPEGVDVALEYQASFRYDPSTHFVYFKDIKPIKPMVFASNSLEGYVPQKDREAIAKTIAGVLEAIPLCQMPKDFAYKNIKAITVIKDLINIDFN